MSQSQTENPIVSVEQPKSSQNNSYTTGSVPEEANDKNIQANDQTNKEQTKKTNNQNTKKQTKSSTYQERLNKLASPKNSNARTKMTSPPGPNNAKSIKNVKSPQAKIPPKKSVNNQKLGQTKKIQDKNDIKTQPKQSNIRRVSSPSQNFKNPNNTEKKPEFSSSRMRSPTYQQKNPKPTSQTQKKKLQQSKPQNVQKQKKQDVTKQEAQGEKIAEPEQQKIGEKVNQQKVEEVKNQNGGNLENNQKQESVLNEKQTGNKEISQEEKIEKSDKSQNEKKIDELTPKDQAIQQKEQIKKELTKEKQSEKEKNQQCDQQKKGKSHTNLYELLQVEKGPLKKEENKKISSIVPLDTFDENESLKYFDKSYNIRGYQEQTFVISQVWEKFRIALDHLFAFGYDMRHKVHECSKYPSIKDIMHTFRMKVAVKYVCWGCNHGEVNNAVWVQDSATLEINYILQKLAAYYTKARNTPQYLEQFLVKQDYRAMGERLKEDHRHPFMFRYQPIIYQQKCKQCHSWCKGNIFKDQLAGVLVEFCLFVQDLVQRKVVRKKLNQNRQKTTDNSSMHTKQFCQACEKNVCLAVDSSVQL